MPPFDAPIDLPSALAHLTPEETEGISGAALFCWDPQHDRLCFSEHAMELRLGDMPPAGWSLDQALTVVVESSLRAAQSLVAEMRAMRPCGPTEMTVESGGATRRIEVRTLPVLRGGRAYVIGAIRDRSEEYDLLERLTVTARVMSNLARVAKIGAWELDWLRRRVEISEDAAAICGVQGPIPLDELQSLIPEEVRRAPEAAAFVAQVRKNAQAEFVARGSFGGASERFIRVTARPRRDPDGTVLRVDGTVSDVTALVDLGRRNGWLEAAFSATAQGVCVTDAEQRIVMVNPAFTEVTGYRPDEVIGQRPALLASGRQDRAFYEAMWASIRQHGRWSGELWNRRRDGSHYLESLTIIALREAEQVVGYVGLFSDLSAREAARERHAWLQEHDRTTGLLNRAGLERALRAQRRPAEQELAVIALDLDGFSAINHSFGVHGADDVLCAVAHRILDCVGRDALVARLGSDDFVIVLGEPKAAEPTVAQLRRRIREVVEVQGARIHLDAAFGYAVGCGGAAGGLGDLSTRVTVALAAARVAGRGSIVRFEPELAERSRSEFELSQALPDALIAGQMHVVFQPQFDLRSGRIVAAEALMRWTHPDRGPIRPDHFIAAAERSGDILAIGSLALHASLALLARVDEEGLELERVAVNVAATEIRDGGLVERVRAALSSSGAAAGRLEMEVTEGLLVSQSDAIAQLDALRQLGVQVAIDDFGVGFSSLGRLKQLPLDRLKIDRSFVIGLPDDPSDAAVCRSIIDLAHHMGLGVIAEGVEDPAQERWLQNVGCDQTQGYLRGRPMSEEALLQRLRQQASSIEEGELR